MNKRVFILFAAILFFVFAPIDPSATAQEDFRFAVSFSKEVHKQPITGRVYIIISKNGDREPRFQVRPTGVPIWGKNIDQLSPDAKVIIDETVFGYPLESIREIPAGDYYVQAFINVYTKFQRADGHTIWLHQDQWEGQRWNRSPGNLYSAPVKIHLDPSTTGTVNLVCNKKIPPIKLPEDTKHVKHIRFRSKILSDFWGQPMYLGATVLLPRNYDEHPDVYYPVNYIQGHFSLRPPHNFREPGTSSNRGRGDSSFSKFWLSDSCPRVISVTFQHPCPYYDDSYGVNSPNTGPYGDAIMQELIPKIESTFRIIRKPYARILSGGSTGGWIALALQIFHPDFFGGTFASCPDPVDFRYYQIINIYDDENAYYRTYDWLKIERPNQRRPDGEIISTIRNENVYELVIGDKSRSGGQWDIWEAVFSPIGPDGYPQRIWNKRTGEIDHQVAEQWKKYDLRLYLQQHWSDIGTKLVGKLHIYTGSMDSFYLNNAVHLLEQFLESTTDPYYNGTVKYGARKPHCWGPRGKEFIQLMADYVTKTAPPSENTQLWKY